MHSSIRQTSALRTDGSKHPPISCVVWYVSQAGVQPACKLWHGLHQSARAEADSGQVYKQIQTAALSLTRSNRASQLQSILLKDPVPLRVRGNLTVGQPCAPASPPTYLPGGAVLGDIAASGRCLYLLADPGSLFKG